MATRDDAMSKTRGQEDDAGTRGHFARGVNVGDLERIVSLIGGGALALYGLARVRPSGLALAALGGALIYRGATGFCRLYRTLGVDGASTLTGQRRGNRGIKIEHEATIAVPPDTLYRPWRNFENLPRFMSHLERVRVIDERRSHWTVKTAPGVPDAARLAWDAEIINDRPGELIAWESIGDAPVDHAGSVRFQSAPDGRSTIVRVSLQYDPPGGQAAHAVAALFGQDARSQIAADLEDFKRALEAVEIARGA